MAAKTDATFNADAQLLLHAWQENLLDQTNMFSCVAAHLLTAETGLLIERADYDTGEAGKQLTWMGADRTEQRALGYAWYSQLTKFRAKEKNAHVPEGLSQRYTIHEIDLIEHAFELTRDSWGSLEGVRYAPIRECLASALRVLADVHKASPVARELVFTLLQDLPEPDDF